MTYAQFLERFNEFKGLNEGLFNAVSEEAKLEVSPKIWGRFYESGVANLTAHILAVSGYLKTGASNTPTAEPQREITSKSVGSLSVSYATTKYGQRYLELKRLIMPHFGVVR
ncbi:DUF4054 domain-containing protein [Campylobacter sp. 9BO]|uniref:DUF4054 domain-containing protein n=1 Tax=Campylobacter sp. 9BO TaxID=3424759 RepID=UPI003D3379D0